MPDTTARTTALTVPCTYCNAKPGQECTNTITTQPLKHLAAHVNRIKAADERLPLLTNHKGTQFERAIADYLAHTLDDDRVDRRVKRGIKDRGDISGLRIHGQHLVAECKNTTRLCLPEWTTEANVEAGNDDAIAGIVIHKRSRVRDCGQQWVTMTVDDLCALITGQRHGHRA